MKETRCIICGSKKNGLEVEEDHVIKTIRWFKKNVTHNEKGARLIVCKECYPRYSKNRRSYERRQLLYVGLGLIMAILLVAAGQSFIAILYGAVIVVFMYVLSLLTYMPKVLIPASKKR